EEAMFVAMMKPNVYMDTAAWGNYCEPSVYFYRVLRTICDMVGSDRILFGSDWPLTPKPLLSEAQWVDKFRNPPPQVKAAGIEFTSEEIEAILGRNAARVLG
ncbi:MAG: amidohydrolase family protein, partial [Candidatus Hadarchaeales archaeon]